jgi:hypothetical protein
MSDKPYPSGIKPMVNTEPNEANTGFVRTNMYTQTISEGKVDIFAQDYIEPDHKKA